MNMLIKILMKSKITGILSLFVACSILTLHANDGVSQSFNISGKVSDAGGEPLIGVNVSVKGTTTGTVTDMDGMYTLSVPDRNGTLVFSYVGFAPQEIAINNQQTINVTLTEDSQLMDEVVVVGFGRQKKASVVGAVSTLKPKDLKVPSSNLSNAFAGKLAGVIAVQRTGEPGADGSSFWIRGISTFAGSTSPLIFIDGVEATTADMNALAPEVIEGFSILKDATATALYGARGANGVMLVTTKQGSNMERARINVRVEGAMTQPTRMVDLADGVDYMNGFNTALTTRGASPEPRFTDYKIQQTAAGANPLLFPNVDWQNTLFNDWAYNQTANLNVTGGGQKVTYFMSASINNDNGMIKSDPGNKYDSNISQQRYSIQGNIAANLTSTTKAIVRLNSNILSYTGSSMSTGDIYTALFFSPGVLFPAYYPSGEGEKFTRFGNLTGGPHATGGPGGSSAYYNVYAQMVSGYRQRNENTNTVAFEVDQDLKFITEGLRVNGLFSFKNWSRTDVVRSFNPIYFEREGNYNDYATDGSYNVRRMNQGNTALSTSTTNQGDRLMNVQFKIDWTRSFGKHDLSAMMVYLMRDFNNNNPAYDSADASVTYYKSLPTRNQGVAGRFTYAYDSRYLAELNFGYNGSENFAKGERYGFFPSVGLGYNISNEAFWEPLSKAIPTFKIYGSLGLVGNASTSSRFPYLTKVNLIGRGYTFGYDRTNTMENGAVVTVMGAEKATWEKGLKANVGVDMNLFNALQITLDAYQEERSGIFMQYRTMPIESGISGDLVPYANLGVVKNSGFDLAVDFNRSYLNNELIVNLRGTVTYSKNELVDRDEPAGIPDYMSEIGKPLNMNMGLVSLGLFKDDADVANSPNQTFSDYGPGDIKYKDMNSDGQIDANDRTHLGDPTVPLMVYGFGASAQYKGFDASIFFQGVGKTSLMMGDIHPFGNQYTQMYQFIADDHWTEENQNMNAAYPRLVSGVAPNAHNNHQASSFWQRDGSFLRLKNLEVGYTYKFVRFYLSGQNLLTFSKFNHWDPELGGIDRDNGYISGQARGLKYPTLRTFMTGLQFTF
jgi:TonB-linked SusC/RagA family outer membrane protein